MIYVIFNEDSNIKWLLRIPLWTILNTDAENLLMLSLIQHLYLSYKIAVQLLANNAIIFTNKTFIINYFDYKIIIKVVFFIAI